MNQMHLKGVQRNTFYAKTTRKKSKLQEKNQEQENQITLTRP